MQPTASLRVFRYSPSRGPGYHEYRVPVWPGMTVLDALLHVKDNMDQTLAFRYSCRMATCGSCGMKINGLPRLACHTQMAKLGRRIVLEPLSNLPVIRDLATEFEPLLEKLKSIKPSLIRTEAPPERELLQTPEEWGGYIQFAQCIKCGLCYAACPTVATDKLFLGPQALTEAYRYNADSRDQGSTTRLRILDRHHSLASCHFAGACSFVCPKGVDPSLAVQLLRRQLVRAALPFPKSAGP